MQMSLASRRSALSRMALRGVFFASPQPKMALSTLVSAQSRRRNSMGLAAAAMETWSKSPLAPAGTRSLFIQTEETPNPSSLKFIPGKPVLPEEFGSSMDFRKGDGAMNSPLARLLLRVQGVQGVFLGNDFITVSKEETLSWGQLKPEIFGTIMDFYEVGKPAVSGPSDQVGVEGGASDEEDSEVVLLIKELLEERIRPMVHEDGGDIFFQGFDEESGIVRVKLAGSCSGCPSSSVTLKSGVENMLMHYIPEVKGVQAVGELDDDPNERKLTFNSHE